MVIYDLIAGLMAAEGGTWASQRSVRRHMPGSRSWSGWGLCWRTNSRASSLGGIASPRGSCWPADELYTHRDSQTPPPATWIALLCHKQEHLAVPTSKLQSQLPAGGSEPCLGSCKQHTC